MGKELTLPLPVAVFGWYASSVYCTTTSKSLPLDEVVLTLSQLMMASLCGFVLLPLTGTFKYAPVPNMDYFLLASLLSLVFVCGFGSLNSAIKELQDVPLAMTLRAAEPAFALICTAVLLKSEKVTLKTALAVLPIIIGGGMAAYKSNPGDLNKFGILLCVICNMCFAIRGVVTKKNQRGVSIDRQPLPVLSHLLHWCCYPNGGRGAEGYHGANVHSFGQ